MRSVSNTRIIMCYASTSCMTDRCIAFDVFGGMHLNVLYVRLRMKSRKSAVMPYFSSSSALGWSASAALVAATPPMASGSCGAKQS